MPGDLGLESVGAAGHQYVGCESRGKELEELHGADRGSVDAASRGDRHGLDADRWKARRTLDRALEHCSVARNEQPGGTGLDPGRGLMLEHDDVDRSRPRHLDRGGRDPWVGEQGILDRFRPHVDGRHAFRQPGRRNDLACPRSNLAVEGDVSDGQVRRLVNEPEADADHRRDHQEHHRPAQPAPGACLANDLPPIRDPMIHRGRHGPSPAPLAKSPTNMISGSREIPVAARTLSRTSATSRYTSSAVAVRSASKKFAWRGETNAPPTR